MNPADDEQIEDDVEVVLRETRRNFISGFGAACAAMARLIDELAGDTSSSASRSELEHLLHRMGGLSGTIGFPTVSARAREFEDHLRDTMSDQLDRSTALRLLEMIRSGFEQDASA